MTVTAQRRQTVDAPERGFDPEDWSAFEALLQSAAADMVNHLRTIGQRPAWQPLPAATRELFTSPLPEKGQGLEATYREVLQHVVPYQTANIHPRFWSWVGGTGTHHGVLADLMTSTMNSSNLGFDEAATTHLEIQLIDWLKGMFGFPDAASGLLVSGGSMANLVGLTVARNAMAGYDVRAEGLNPPGQPPLRLYASTETHSSVRKAVELLGLGAEALVLIPVRDDFTIDLVLLDDRICVDRAAGLRPIAVIANAGTVNTGAVDPLDAMASLCRRHHLWLHVDGAFGALAAISKAREQVRGLDRADSLAFDLHKWMYQQYDMGCALVRHGDAHRATFNVTPPYLRRMDRGLGAGPSDFSELGVQLSRSGKALRAWMTLKAEGLEAFRRAVDQNLDQARYLSDRVDVEPRLERLAPTALNVVNFRYRPEDWADEALNALNRQIVQALHERGIATPSTTVLNGRLTIRVAICNHRSRRADFDTLVDAVLAIGRELEGGQERKLNHG